MALKIRLARGGAKKKAYYRLVVAENTSPRDGKFIERLGSYNPMIDHDKKDRYLVNQERVKHWLSVGAQPTERVAKIFGILGIMEKAAIPEQTKKSQPKVKK